MADGALERFEADIAVGITGIAGPDGGTEEKPVGYVCVCVKTTSGAKLARDPVIPGTRADIRERSALLGMHLAPAPAAGRGFSAVAFTRGLEFPTRRCSRCLPG